MFFKKSRSVKPHETAQAKSLAAFFVSRALFVLFVPPVGLSKAPRRPLLSHDKTYFLAFQLHA
jgi:hypothetical protein